MNQRLFTIVASLWLLNILPLSAQLGLSMPTVNDAFTGQVLNLPVTVFNFDSVATAQFVIRWDPDVLEFEEVNTLVLPGLDIDDHFGVTEVGSGILRFAWLAPQSVLDNGGVILSDGASIFKIKFKVVGPEPSSSSVLITELLPNTVFEITTVNGLLFELDNTNIDDGFVAVGYSVSADEPLAQGPIMEAGVSPNPFVHSTTLRLNLAAASDVRLMICDATGRIFFDEKKFLLPGEHGIEIDNTQMKANTAYYLIVQSNGQTLVKPLFLL